MSCQFIGSGIKDIAQKMKKSLMENLIFSSVRNRPIGYLESLHNIAKALEKGVQKFEPNVPYKNNISRETREE